MLQQWQVVDVIGQQHAGSLGPLPAGQKLLHPAKFFCTAVQCAGERQLRWRGKHIAKPQ